MRAAVIDQFGIVPEIRDVPEPDCPRNGVIVGVEACGICRSDHHAWSGADADVLLPHVGGHEFAGVVLETGSSCRTFKVGDRVTAPFIIGCGVCADCISGEATICNDQQVIGFTQWGAFAEQVAISNADFNLVLLPESLDFVPAAAMGCRLTTAWRALTSRAELGEGEWLAVYGAGGIGLSAIMIAFALGARTIAVDINETSLELAKKAGAELVVNVTDVSDVPSTIRDLTGGGAHVSIDALGITETFQNSVRSLRKLGRHVQIGMPLGAHASVDLPLLDLVYARQISIMGTRGMAASQFPPLLGLVADGRIDVAGLVSRTVGIENLGAELELLGRFGGAGIAVIDRF